MDKESSKILKGADEIAGYGRITREIFYLLLEKGFPALKVGRAYYSHKDNVDEYFRRVTRVTGPQPAIPEEAEEMDSHN